MRFGTRTEPGHLLPCLLRLRELGYAQVWCRDELEGHLDLDELIIDGSGGDPAQGAPIFFVDGNRICMLVDEATAGMPFDVVYRGTTVCPRGGLS